MDEKNTEDIFVDDSGREFRWVLLTRKIVRKTHIFGQLHGKYRGENDKQKESEDNHYAFFSFELYEAEVRSVHNYKIEIGNDTTKNEQINFKHDESFPSDILPSTIPIIVQENSKEYEVILRNPYVAKVNLNRRLHQQEGDEIFGTIDADVIGYVLDFVSEDYYDKLYIPFKQSVEKDKNSKPNVQSTTKCVATGIKTGKRQKKENYYGEEFWYSNYSDTYWGDYIYTDKGKPQDWDFGGCVTAIVQLIGILLVVFFLIGIFANLPFLIPLILIPLIVRLIPYRFWVGLFKIIGILLIGLFIFSLIKFLNGQSQKINTIPLTADNPTESTPHNIDTSNTSNNSDTIFHKRIWKDLAGKVYQGKFWVLKSEYITAHNFKNNLPAYGNEIQAYDKVVSDLNNNDRTHLKGVYTMFDSLKKNNNLNYKEFAEIIVSFVQDIPYAVVLPQDCDPDLYDDRFIKEYLKATNSICDANEKFGLNSPVEFMASLKGDCDTRTLFLYTVLKFYNYDVALLSSEFYNHSLIGINLPYEGSSLVSGKSKYVLWETTSINFPAGLIPKEISNTSHWRVSLK